LASNTSLFSTQAKRFTTHGIDALIRCKLRSIKPIECSRRPLDLNTDKLAG
jgi:hypothetical protein